MEKQKFIGGLVAKVVLDKAVEKALDRVVRSPSIKVGPKEAEAIKQVVTAELEEVQTKHEEFKTNNEPIYQSPVSLGSIAGILSGLGTVVQVFSDARLTEDEYGLLATAITAILGGGFALWGRWFAKKPLGS